jgi:hypothetical protein
MATDSNEGLSLFFWILLVVNGKVIAGSGIHEFNTTR